MAEGRLSGEEVEAAAAFRREVWWDAADAGVCAPEQKEGPIPGGASGGL